MHMNQQIPAADRAGFTIAHLSDPHLTSLDGVHWRQLLNKRVLGYVSWRKKRRAEHRPEILEALLQDLRETRPQHIAITGDLTQVGLPEEFEQARRWLDRVGEAGDVTVVPGNHEAYVGTDWAETYAQWEPFLRSDPGYPSSDQRGEGMFPSLRVRGRVALIGLSSAVPTAPFLASGRLGAGQRERLATLLRRTGAEGLFRLVLIHHPPRVEDEKWRKRLSDGRALCAILADAGAELVLHGHGHYFAQARVSSARGDIPVFGIPSASAVGHKPGRTAQYRLYRVRRCAENWAVQIDVREYRADLRRFVPHGQHHLSLPAIPSTSS